MGYNETLCILGEPMFNFNTDPHAEKLNARITKLLDVLDGLDGSTEEYTKTTINLVKLLELKDRIIKTGNETDKIKNDQQKFEGDQNLEAAKITLDREKFAADQEKTRSWKPSPDAIIGGAVSLIGILAILHHEKLNVVSSKALGFVGRMR